MLFNGVSWFGALAVTFVAYVGYLTVAAMVLPADEFDLARYNGWRGTAIALGYCSLLVAVAIVMQANVVARLGWYRIVSAATVRDT